MRLLYKIGHLPRIRRTSYIKTHFLGSYPKTGDNNILPDTSITDKRRKKNRRPRNHLRISINGGKGLNDFGIYSKGIGVVKGTLFLKQAKGILLTLNQ